MYLIITNIFLSIFSVFVIHFSILENYSFSHIYNVLRNYKCNKSSRSIQNNRIIKVINDFFLKENIVFFVLFFLLNIFVYFFTRGILFKNTLNFGIINKSFLQNYLLLYMVLLASFIDIKYRFFPNFLFFLMMFISIYASMNRFLVIVDVIICLGILLFFYFLGKKIFKEEAFGMGDVNIFICLGIFYGFREFLNILCISCLFGSIFGYLYIFYKKFITKRNISNLYLPFIPFIFFAILLHKLILKKVVF